MFDVPRFVHFPICHLQTPIFHLTTGFWILAPVIISSGKITSSGKVFHANNNGAKYRIFISPRIMVLQSRK